jgi:uncharacterized membrane protein
MSTAAFVTLLTAALACRLLLTATSFGSTDALLLMRWSHLAEHFGIAFSYQHAPYLNHPPLALWILTRADSVGRAVGVELPDIFRLIQSFADMVTGALLYAHGRAAGRAREAAAFFFASPAAIFLSGFHCNSDPTMIALLFASVLTAARAPIASGALLGASSGIKIAPLPLAPFFLIDMTWRRRFFFLLSLFSILAIIFLPAITMGGTTVLQNVFGYHGSGYEWGFCGVGYLLGSFHWARFYSQYGRYVVVAVLIVLWMIFYRRRMPLMAMIGVALLTMNFFSPGFGVQYLVWPLPFLLFSLPRWLAYALNVALSLFLFVTYTIWSREFPWWFADAAAPNPLRPLVALLALPLWLLYGWAIFVAIKKSSASTAMTSEP